MKLLILTIICVLQILQDLYLVSGIPGPRGRGLCKMCHIDRAMSWILSGTTDAQK